MKTISTFLLSLIWFVSLITPSALSQEVLPVTNNRITVGTIERKPFSWKKDGVWTGISIELVQKIAQEDGKVIEYKEYTVFSDMINAVKESKIDVSVANISVTEEREKVLDFTQGYYQSGLQMITHSDFQQTDIWAAVQSSGVLNTVIFMGIFIAIGALLYFFWEYRGHYAEKITQQKSKDKAFRSVWWSTQRVLNVNVDAKDPSTISGKLLAMFLAVCSIFLLSILTAQFASSLTAQTFITQLQTPQDLSGKSVIVLEKSTADLYLTTSGIAHTTTSSVDELYSKVESKEFDVGVYDEPLIKYKIKNTPSSKLVIAGNPFTKEYYAIALPTGSSLRERFDQLIIKYLRSGELTELEERYLGK
jgi:polar amino acid transport system substrate-binding protein